MSMFDTTTGGAVEVGMGVELSCDKVSKSVSQ